MTERINTSPTTSLIPTSRFKEQDLVSRLLPRNPSLSDQLQNFMEFGTRPTLELPMVRFAHRVYESQAAAIKKAQEELLNVDKTAMRVFVCFAKSAYESSSAGIETAILERLAALSESNPNIEPLANLPPFYEPITFNWTKHDEDIKQAAKLYSEHKHADH